MSATIASPGLPVLFRLDGKLAPVTGHSLAVDGGLLAS
jgi:hypothetical protein